jgi:hypothetical protein
VSFSFDNELENEEWKRAMAKVACVGSKLTHVVPLMVDGVDSVRFDVEVIGVKKKKIDHQFDIIDVDKNGDISREEFEAYFGSRE